MNRDINIQLGGQSISVRTTTMLSNVRIRNARDCDFGNGTTQSESQDTAGSSFDIQKSPTWVTTSQDTWNMTTVDAHNEDGYDVAQFYDLSEISGFSFEVWSNTNSDNQSGLALSPNSSFIEALVDAEVIPSCVFGLFFGSRNQPEVSMAI